MARTFQRQHHAYLMLFISYLEFEWCKNLENEQFTLLNGIVSRINSPRGPPGMTPWV